MNGAAAYQQLTKTEDSLSQASQYWGGIEAKKRAQERAEIREDLQTYDKRFKEGSQSFLPSMSGQAALDRAYMQLADFQSKRYADNGRKIKELLSQGKTGEARQLEHTNQSILNSFKTMKQFTDAGAAKVEQYLADVQAGKVDPLDDKFPMIADALANGQYLYTLNDSGQPVAEFYLADGRTEIISPTDFVNGSIGYNGAFNAQGFAQGLGKTMGTLTQDVDKGLYLSSGKSASPEALKSLDLQVDELLRDPSKARQALLQITGETNRSGNLTDTQKNAVREGIKNMALGTLDTEDKIKSDPTESLKRQDERLRFEKQKEARRVEGKDKGDLNTLSIMSDGDKPLTRISSSGSNQTGYSLNKIVKVSPDSKEGLSSIYIGDDGSVSYGYYDNVSKGLVDSDFILESGIRQSIKEEPKKESEKVKFFETLNFAARQIDNPEGGKFKSFEELKNSLKPKKTWGDFN